MLDKYEEAAVEVYYCNGCPPSNSQAIAKIADIIRKHFPEPQAAASGEVDADNPATWGPREVIGELLTHWSVGHKMRDFPRCVARARELFAGLATHPTLTDKKALRESWIRQIYPVVRKALVHAMNNLPKCDMGTTHDEDVRRECREAMEALNRSESVLLSHEAPTASTKAVKDMIEASTQDFSSPELDKNFPKEEHRCGTCSSYEQEDDHCHSGDPEADVSTPGPCGAWTPKDESLIVTALREIARGLVAIDWCIGYDLTNDQYIELDRIRSKAADLLTRESKGMSIDS